MDAKIISAIEAIVGRQNVKSSEEERKCYSYDGRTTGSVPDLIVFPASAHDVSAILKLANTHLFPVIPRGQGTGLTGGSVPVKGGVVLSFTRMNRILEIDAENLITVVEPGVITFLLQEEVAKKGLFYPPDPASYKYSSIGGNVAECAGGPNSLKYGVTRDYVLGIEVVLPTGEVLNLGVRTMKGVVGYDLTRLFVGSEGTLGVITRITLKLIPLPETKATILALSTRSKRQPKRSRPSSPRRWSHRPSSSWTGRPSCAARRHPPWACPRASEAFSSLRWTGAGNRPWRRQRRSGP